MGGLSDEVRRIRRSIKASLPYVRRREYALLRRRHDALIDAFTGDSLPATAAGICWQKRFQTTLTGEVCLFVTHATTGELKPHVAHYIDLLLANGFAVILVVNADRFNDPFLLPPTMLDRLAGCMVRENVGFDFAAWGHAYSLGEGFPDCSRLMLVNDSMVGPLGDPAFQAVLTRLRASSADVVGLTENALPHRHLQSYFLSFGVRALQSKVFRQAFLAMRSLPTKELVIDAYETSLTRQFERSGLVVTSLFPPLYKDPRSADDTLIRWRELVDAGFPFVKASLLRSRSASAVRLLVPPALLPKS